MIDEINRSHNSGIFRPVLISRGFGLCVDLPKMYDEKEPWSSTCVKCPCKERYYLPTEVVIHNSPKDCWVSYLEGVYDLTDLCSMFAGSDQLKPILAHAGKDISHWFDHETHDIRHYVHPVTGVIVPYCPHGPIPDVNPAAPATSWRPLDRCPWWLEKRYRMGNLTRNPRPCKVMNVLAGTQAVITVSLKNKYSDGEGGSKGNLSLCDTRFVLLWGVRYFFNRSSDCRDIGLRGRQYPSHSRAFLDVQRSRCVVHLEIWGKKYRSLLHLDRKRNPRWERSVHWLWITRRFLYTVSFVLLQRRFNRSLNSYELMQQRNLIIKWDWYQYFLIIFKLYMLYPDQTIWEMLVDFKPTRE